MLSPDALQSLPMNAIDYRQLAEDIRLWGAELGFGRVGIAGVDLEADEAHLLNWLEAGYHGDMDYMSRHGTKRSRPADLQPGTVRVIAARMDYAPPGIEDAWDVLADDEAAYVSRYALGRDYHKILRGRLQKLADRIADVTGEFGHRVFTDSAPVLEKALARDAGLGWIGKHTLLLSRDAGSWFFLGEIYTDLPLPIDAPETPRCGTCRRCIESMPRRKIRFGGDLRELVPRTDELAVVASEHAVADQWAQVFGNRAAQFNRQV